MTYSYMPAGALVALAFYGATSVARAQQSWEMKAQAPKQQTPAEIRIREAPVQSGSFTTSGALRAQPLIRVERPPVIDVTTVRSKASPVPQAPNSPRAKSPRNHR